MVVKVLIYAYATGVFSSRAIARKLEEDVSFRVLAAGNFPQHRTICEFRRRHLEDFERLFVEVVRVAREMGVVRFGTLSVDGTKVRANASKRKAMSYGRMLQEEARLKEEIEGLLERAGAVDGEEDERYGEEMRGDELPAELQRREKRLAAIAAAKARLEAAQRAGDDARGRTPGQGRNPKGGRPYKRAYGEPEAQSNFTDAESRIMNTSTEGFQQCYNAQTAVDGAHRIIRRDAGGCAGQRPGPADAVARRGERQLRGRARGGTGRRGLLQRGGPCGAGGARHRWLCGTGPGGQGPGGGRPAHPCGDASHGREAEKLARAKGKAQYAKRKWMSEGPNGWVKEVLGFRRFSLRGLDKVRGEWHLVCLALNIRRLAAMAA